VGVPQPGVAEDDVDAQLVDDQKLFGVRRVADSHLECGGAGGRDGAVLACQLYGGHVVSRPPPMEGLCFLKCGTHKGDSEDTS
jgi:hypothetical protein